MDAAGSVRDNEVSVDGVRLHYREWGDPAAPDVLILHGLTGHAWEFDGLAAQLARDCHVIAVNQRGHGASDWAPAYAPTIMAEDIGGVIDAIGLTDVSIVGHSMGGINSWLFAANHRDLIERLVIIDVGPDALEPDEVQQAWQETLEHSQRATFADPEGATTEYLAGRTGAAADLLRRFVHQNLRQREDGLWVWRYDAGGLTQFVAGAQASADHWDALRKITCPTLLVRAGGDGALPVSTAEHMAREIPSARYVEIPDSGHDIHFDQPEALLRELRHFLDLV